MHCFNINSTIKHKVLMLFLKKSLNSCLFWNKVRGLHEARAWPDWIWSCFHSWYSGQAWSSLFLALIFFWKVRNTSEWYLFAHRFQNSNCLDQCTGKQTKNFYRQQSIQDTNRELSLETYLITLKPSRCYIMWPRSSRAFQHESLVVCPPPNFHYIFIFWWIQWQYWHFITQTFY